jgi:hypothetical protein
MSQPCMAPPLYASFSITKKRHCRRSCCSRIGFKLSEKKKNSIPGEKHEISEILGQKQMDLIFFKTKNI